MVAEARHFEKLYGRRIPVIAAGGLYTGEDIYWIRELGADGVQLGSKFVTTEECDASQAFKDTYINSREEDIEIIASPVGMPGRAIAGEFIRRVREGLTRPKKCRSTASRPATTPRVPTALSWRCTMRPKATCPADTLSQEPMRSCPKRSRASAKRSLRYRPSSAQRNCAANAARCRYNARQGRAAACFQNGIRRYFLSLGIVFV